MYAKLLKLRNFYSPAVPRAGLKGIKASYGADNAGQT